MFIVSAAAAASAYRRNANADLYVCVVWCSVLASEEQRKEGSEGETREVINGQRESVISILNTQNEVAPSFSICRLSRATRVFKYLF